MSRGTEVPDAAPLAVIVMSIDSDTRAVEAVRSILGQAVSCEIAVVNTGAGSLAAQLADVAHRIVLIESAGRRLPGGTRNLGIAHTNAPVVAFLAADCVAADEWAGNRLAAHQSADAVASALRPLPRPDGVVPLASWATYAMLHVRRAPEYPADEAALFGASYRRGLFDQHGLFDADLRIGEDTEFHERMAATCRPAWAPEVLTFHSYPVTISAAVADAFRRGRLLHEWLTGRRARPLLVAFSWIAGGSRMARKLPDHCRGEVRAALKKAEPIGALLSAAQALGAVASAVARRPSIAAD